MLFAHDTEAALGAAAALVNTSPGVDGDDGLADLTSLEPVQLNDMVVDANGRAYIGGFGFDLNRGEPPAPSAVYLVADSYRREAQTRREVAR